MTTRTLNIAMIGHGFMGRAHSNAFHQVGHFFDTPFTLKRKVICGRNQQAVQEMADPLGMGRNGERLARGSRSQRY